MTYAGEGGDGPIKNIGINLGAPGNRRAPDGGFWLAYPLLPHVAEPEKESGLSADISVEAKPEGVYAHHASRIVDGHGWSWVAASGYRGIFRLELDLRTPQPASYEVRLHFAEPDHTAPGKRLFDVLIEEQKVLEDFDIFAAAGGRNRSLVRAFAGIEIEDGKLTLEFVAPRSRAGETASLPLLCGIELGLETD